MISGDSLAINYSGQDDAGGAYILKGNRALDSFEKSVHDQLANLAKKKTEVAKAAQGLDTSDIGEKQVLENHVPEMLKQVNNFVKERATFESYYNKHPQEVGGEKYATDYITLQQKKNDLTYKAQLSATAREKREKEAGLHAQSEPGTYDPNEMIGYLSQYGTTSFDDVGSMSKLIQGQAPQKSYNYDQNILSFANGIAKSTITTDKNGLKTTVTNKLFDEKGNPTKYKTDVVDAQIDQFIMTEKGRAAVTDKYKQGKKDDPTYTIQQATADVANDVYGKIDQSYQQDRDRPPAAEKPVEIASVKVTDGRNIGGSVAMATKVGGRDIGEIQDDANARKSAAVKKLAEATTTADKKAAQEELNAANAAVQDATKLGEAAKGASFTSVKTKTFPTTKVKYAADKYINLDTGKEEPVTGAIDYEFSSIDKLPYTIDPKTGERFIVREKIAKGKNTKAGVKYDWFAIGEEAAGSKGGNEIHKPVAVPVTQELMDHLNESNKGKVEKITTDEISYQSVQKARDKKTGAIVQLGLSDGKWYNVETGEEIK